MRFTHSCALGALLFLGSTTSALQEPPVQEPRVSLEALADTEAIAPGQTFHVAAYFELPRHWHIYWENPGESGMATSVKLSAPEGFQVGAPLFPGPKSMEVELEIESFVYEDSVAIFVPVTAPAELDAEASYTFELSAEWLVCKRECFLQDGSKKLTLGAHAGAGKPGAANQKQLAASFARLPRPQAECEALRFQWQASPPDFRARMVVRGATSLEFFPGLESNLVLTRVVRNPGGNGYEMAVDFSSTPGQEEDPPIATGVLHVVYHDKTESYYHVNFAPEPKPDSGIQTPR